MTAESNVTDRHAGAMALVRRLRALLDDEFEALKAQDLEWFERMQPLKLELLQSLGSAMPPDSTATAADAAQVALQKLPRNGAAARVRNRCQLTGRSRAYIGTFGLSRIAFREMALQGLIPGVRKASW